MITEADLYEDIPDHWCAYHQTIEICPPGQPACGECWHEWASEDHLIADYVKMIFELSGDTVDPALVDIDEIFACPHCSHDL